MSFYSPCQTLVIIVIVLCERFVFVHFIYIKENNNSKADPMYIKIQTCNDQRERKTNHFRTTVNRRTLVGRVERVNEERVCVVVVPLFGVCADVVTKQLLKSPVPSSYIEESSTKPVAFVCVSGRAVPAVVMINCCGC